MNSVEAHRKKNKLFFAVAALGKDRWYWVVWPSLEMLQSGQTIQLLRRSRIRYFLVPRIKNV